MVNKSLSSTGILLDNFGGKPLITRKNILGMGEPGGTRTRDPMIKSHVLYRLSYGLGPRVCTGGLVRGQ
jgi:hypothetical protein